MTTKYEPRTAEEWSAAINRVYKLMKTRQAHYGKNGRSAGLAPVVLALDEVATTAGPKLRDLSEHDLKQMSEIAAQGRFSRVVLQVSTTLTAG